MYYHDKSSHELKQWKDYCKEQVKAASDPLGHLSGRADSDAIIAENNKEIQSINNELRNRGDD